MFKIEKFLKNKHSSIFDIASIISLRFRRVWAVMEHKTGLNLQTAVIVFNHFPVIKLFKEKLSDFRRQLYNNTTEKLHRSVIKETRWLLLTSKEKLENKEDQVQRLKRALDINKPLATVYYMKKDLRQI